MTLAILKLITNLNIAKDLLALSAPFFSYKFSFAHSQTLFCPVFAYQVTHAKEKKLALSLL